jgi:hypothetical protein
LLVAALAAPLAVAEGLGRFQDWQTQTYEEDGAKVCSTWSAPQKDEGDYTRRGEIFAFVTHRNGARRRNEVSLEMGYPLKNGTDVIVRIGGAKFAMFTKGSKAWNRSSDADDKMAKAMRGGRKLIVEGVSRRGTKTRDTYSLYGFTAAHKAISAACK